MLPSSEGEGDFTIVKFRLRFGRCRVILKQRKETPISYRKWTPAQKMAIVLEGLKSQSTVAVIYRNHGISKMQYYPEEIPLEEAA